LELILIGFIAILTSFGTSTLLNRKKEPQRSLTYEQGKQLAVRIKATEQEQQKQTETFKKLNNKILEQTQEFNNVDNKRVHKLRDIENLLKTINIRINEKGKDKITEHQAVEQLNKLDTDFKELEMVEQELTKLRNNTNYSIRI